MSEIEIAREARRCVDDCGYSWATACQIVGRIAGETFTVAELQKLCEMAAK